MCYNSFMASKLLFFFFGDDEAYFKTLQAELKESTRLEINFVNVFEREEAKIQSLFLKVYRGKPAAVFIDFSKQPQEYLHLARLLTRTKLDHEFLTIGLVDYLSSADVLSESIATGVNLAYIKSTDTFDVVFDVVKCIAPSEIESPGFATAKLSETWEAGFPSKVGFIHKDGLHVETNFKLSKGDRLRINHAWQKKNLVPSKDVFVRSVSESNLFYQYKASCELDFLFMDEFLPPEGMEPNLVNDKKFERDKMVINCKSQLKKWVKENSSESVAKTAKVLIVDREFSFYQNQPRTDKYPYIIRCIPYFHDMGDELNRLRPQVIAFALEDKEASAKNSNEQLMKLAEVVKAKFEDFKPFIVVFNCKVDSAYLQGAMNYSNVLGTTNELSVGLLMKMAEIFEKKRGGITEGTLFDDREKVFIKKSSTSSICEFLTPLKVIKFSELDMVFESDIDIPVGTNIHLRQPVDMYVNVRGAKSQGKTLEYYGLIHCMGEEEKQELRKFVNTIFFRDHDAKVKADTDQFKNLNSMKLKERIEKEKLESSDGYSNTQEDPVKKGEPDPQES